MDLELIINTQSSLRIRRPTENELGTLERVEITLQSAWDPFDDHYNQLESIAKEKAVN